MMSTIDAALTILGGGLTALYYGGAWLDGRRARRAQAAGAEVAEVTGQGVEDEVLGASAAPPVAIDDAVTSDGEVVEDEAIEEGNEQSEEGEESHADDLPAEATHAVLLALATPAHARAVAARVAMTTNERVCLSREQASALLLDLEEEGLVERVEGTTPHDPAYALTGFGERVVGGGEGGLAS